MLIDVKKLRMKMMMMMKKKMKGGGFGFCCKMGIIIMHGLVMLEIFLFITASGIHAQPSPPDSSLFISIDCGIGNGNHYQDSFTGLTYVSDEEYIDTGIDSSINSKFFSSISKIWTTLRYFPNGTRNCYTLTPVIQHQKYLLRATFVYGNYDGLHKANSVKPLQFDLHIDVNLWATVNITDELNYVTKEVIIVSLVNNSVSLCLINIGNGVPFISSLELRPVKSEMYADASNAQYLDRAYGLNLGADETIRYPSDPYDRLWTGWTESNWVNIATNSSVRPNPNIVDEIRVPSSVMDTAVVPANGSTDLRFSTNFAPANVLQNVFYAYLHFAELVSLRPNQSRAFDIFLNGDSWSSNYSPPYLMSHYLYSLIPLPTNLIYEWKLVPNATSTLPPILNALEVYSIMFITNQPTTTADVDAITAIKDEYRVKKSWSGDPCVPREYAWNGLNCSYDPAPPTIIALNLSSSGLTGPISPLFGKLAAIKYLDLSYNNLTGTIPDTLGELSSLQALYLCGNNVSQKVPASLMERMNNGLKIIFNCDRDKKKIKLGIVIPSIVAGVVVLLIASLFVIWSVRRRHQGHVVGIPIESRKEYYPSYHDSNENYLGQIPKAEEHLIKVDSMKFTHLELAKITKNFSRKIGKGGFGHVYHGHIEPGKEVAVKIDSQSSLGAKQFLAEVQNLTRASHRNLVKLIGYCIDDKYLALVYEYMSQGSIQECLKGVSGKVLSWQERIQIAVGAAQGLEYLHKWCNPPIIHRDIKSSNILLDKDLEAKLADFGLSKTFNYDETHVSTNVVVGTIGYVDPEYHTTCQLTEKSDVYSFGVVLLELLTGQPPLVPGSGKPHLIQVALSRLVVGSIDEIVDQRLEGDFDTNSAWKIADLAKLCTAQTSAPRPTMTEVVTELRDCLELEVARLKSKNKYTDEFSTRSSTAFDEVGEITVGNFGPAAR